MISRPSKIIVFATVAVIAACFALYVARPVIHEEKQEKAVASTNNLTYEQRLLVLEKDINANVPKMIDAATRLDSVKATGRSFTYFYTLVNDVVPEASVRKTLQATEQDRLKTKVINDVEFDELKQASATIIFDYKDKNGAPYVKVKITPEDYHGNKKPEKINPHFE